MDNIPPRLFETLTLPNVAARCFVVRVADAQLTPDNLPTAGTLYRDWTLPSRLHVDTWGSYVYGWPLEAPAGYSAFAFVPALPTTPVVTPRLDPIWGAVIDHTYYCLRSSTQLDVADTSTAIAVLGAAYTTRHVIEVRPPREMSGEVIEVTVTTATAATVTQIDKPVDRESGDSYTRTRTWNVATTAPAGAGIDATSNFTTVDQVSHRLWLSTTQPSSFIPILTGGNITTLTGARQTLTTDSMYWPPVLESYRFDSVFNSLDAIDSNYFELMFTPKIRNGYSGPVKCVVKEWWQATEPNATERPEINQLSMTPVAIRFPGRLQQFSVEPCLHGEVTFSEPNFLGNITNRVGNVTTVANGELVNRTWTAEATTPSDWPATFVVFKSVADNGGYRCEQRTYHRPDVTGGTITISDAAFVIATDGWRDPL